MIHIAAKQLGLEGDEYRAMLRAVTRKESAGDMDDYDRERVIDHLRRCGARFTPPKRRSYVKGSQAALIAHIWSCLARGGAVNDGSDRALRKWVKRTSSTYHPDGVGYDGPELCPPGVARKLIEHLKEWAASQGIAWRSVAPRRRAQG